jgi:hypothetical protein
MSHKFINTNTTLTSKFNQLPLPSFFGLSNKNAFQTNALIDIKHNKTEVVEEANNIQIVDVFQLQDSPKIQSPTGKTHLVLSLIDAQKAPISYENIEKHLLCVYADDKTEIEFKFDLETLTWDSPVERVENKIGYDFFISCIRKYPQITKYGLEITPLVKLRAAFIEVKYDYYISSPTADSTVPDVIQPVQRPTGAEIPPKPIYQLAATTYVTLPTEKDYTVDDLIKHGDAFSTTVYQLLSKTHPDDYTFKSVLKTGLTSLFPPFIDDQISYYDHETTIQLKEFVENEFKYESRDGLDVGNVNPKKSEWRSSLSDLQFRQNTQYTQYYTTTPKKSEDGEPLYPSVDISQELFLYRVKKNVKNELLSSALSGLKAEKSINIDAQFATPITSCGHSNGFQLGTTSSKKNFTEWVDVLGASTLSILCPLDHECQINSDCAQLTTQYGITVCERKTCRFKPKVAPIWVQPGSDATTTSLFFIKILTLLSLVFIVAI